MEGVWLASWGAWWGRDLVASRLRSYRRGKEGHSIVIQKNLHQLFKINTVKPPIKDILKEDKPPNKGQGESTNVYTLSTLKEDNISTKDKTAGPESGLIIMH